MISYFEAQWSFFSCQSGQPETSLSPYVPVVQNGDCNLSHTGWFCLEACASKKQRLQSHAPDHHLISK